MNRIRIALAQICPVPGEKEKNTERILRYMCRATADKAELIVFPECSLTGYTSVPSLLNAIALERDDPSVCRIRKMGRETGLNVCYGYLERTEQGFFITQEIVIDGDPHQYRKTHLGKKEKDVCREGNEIPVFGEKGRIGIQLCWESHIPELSSIQREAGMELLLVPYASPMSGEKCMENWNIHLPARASDNGIFLCACNLLFETPNEIPDDEKGKKYKENDIKRAEESDHAERVRQMKGGGMAVFDPKGKRIAGAFETKEQIIFCDLEGPLPRELPQNDMHSISYYDRKRRDLLFRFL